MAKEGFPKECQLDNSVRFDSSSGAKLWCDIAIGEKK